MEKNDQNIVADLNKQIATMQDEKLRYQQLVARLEINIQTKEDQLKNLENEIEENQHIHQSEVMSLQKALADRNTIIDRILDLQKEQERELFSLKDKLSSAERGLQEGQQSTKMESHRLDQLQAEKNRYMIDLQHAEIRYKELQGQLTEQQQNIQDFFAKESREKDRKINTLQAELDEVQSKNKRRVEEMTREMEKQLEIQRNTMMKELGRNDTSKEVFWNKEREMLKSQLETLSTRLGEQEALAARLKSEGASGREKEVELENVRFVNSNLKSEIDNLKLNLNELKSQNNDLFTRLENKNSEIKELVVFKEKYESSREDQSKLRSELNRRDEELIQFNSELVTLRDRIKNLLIKIDEISNEKTFYEAKVERLQVRLKDMLYTDEKSRPVFNDSSQLKDDIQSELIRAEESEQETC